MECHVALGPPGKFKESWRYQVVWNPAWDTGVDSSFRRDYSSPSDISNKTKENKCIGEGGGCQVYYGVSPYPLCNVTLVFHTVWVRLITRCQPG